MSGIYYREPGCKCTKPELYAYDHDPWCSLNPLYAKKPKLILIYDFDSIDAATAIRIALQSAGINVMAVPQCTLSGPNQSKWLAGSEHILLLCKPSHLVETAQAVQDEHQMWTSIYDEVKT
jgi:hypothetical protein